TLSGNVAFAGGALYLTTTANLTTSTATANLAVEGAAAFLVAASTLNMTGGGLDTNSAPLGGAVFVSGKGAGTTPGMATLDGVAVTNNVADGGTSATGGNGGAIFSSGALTIRNHSAFSGNRVVKSSASGAISGDAGTIFDRPLAVR